MCWHCDEMDDLIINLYDEIKSYCKFNDPMIKNCKLMIEFNNDLYATINILELVLVEKQYNYHMR